MHLIWRERHISRADIARRLGLSRSTVTEIVRDLLETGYVVAVGQGESSGGRRPEVLEFQDDHRHVLGIDIGATHVSVVLMDLAGHVLGWNHRNHGVRNDPDGTMALMKSLCEEMLEANDVSHAGLIAVGVGAPGPVDADAPGVMSNVVLPGWKDQNVGESLGGWFGVRAYIENDANLGALAEMWWGAGRGVRDFMYVKAGYGVGAGYILDGRVYRGGRGLAGEFGHIPADPHGPDCVCGLKGCLVTLMGGEALENRSRQLLPGFPASSLVPATLSLQTVQDAAVRGDELGQLVIREAAGHLGRALAGFVNVMDPRMIVLSGSLMRVRQLVLDQVRETVSTCVLTQSGKRVSILGSSLGPQAVAVGAATLALDHWVSRPGFYHLQPSAGTGRISV
ncbi:MAG: putative NBD/HSP70 family sugar kinase [Rhodothermales bacterium]|jgi:predicted NBD/HSP70 family sugar kinase